MTLPGPNPLSRRRFIKQTSLTAGTIASAGLGAGCAAIPARQGGGDAAAGSLYLIRNLGDTVAETQPARWAVGELEKALQTCGVPVTAIDDVRQAPQGSLVILVSSPAVPGGQAIFSRAGVRMPNAPESFCLLKCELDQREVVLACGADVRGLVYALLELAERVDCAGGAAAALAALRVRQPIVEQPANAIRSINRAFVSNVEDLGWYHDRGFWQKYLAFVVRQRFNRFALTFGIGYDFTTQIHDCYFHFAYPFLLRVPGYEVRATGLSDRERDRNLETLRFISDTATGMGLHFQLGLWTHAYRWTDSPQANYVIDGLTPETHAPYCREAIHTLLQACPAIQGVTIRIHGESGVPEGSYDFWKTVFSGVAACGRKVEIDLHAKGIDQRMIDVALGTGLPVNVSPKYWAEHMGLPYHQAAIRPLEMPPREANDQGFFSMSSGSRRFLRYGYGDLLAENRKHGVLHRIWPGTQRLLLWGDPEMAAGYGRVSSFCGSLGVEICEPLSFKGRKGSGLPGGRDAYADPALKPAGGDWTKYRYTYLLWGRLLYNPQAPPETWRRWLRRHLGPAEAIEHDLAQASRILPLVTTAHDASAANNNYWPEMYFNMSIVDAQQRHPYGDSPSPRRFGTVSPLDPELFSTIEEFADELLQQKPSGKYSPAEVAVGLDQLAAGAAHHLTRALFGVRESGQADFHRIAIDVSLQSWLGKFFAHKLRAGLHAIYERTGSPRAAEDALMAYRAARGAWAALAQAAKDVYVHDITFGPDYYQRGHWADRLPAIDEDIAAMEARLNSARLAASSLSAEQERRARAAIKAVLLPPARLPLRCMHRPPEPFTPGQTVTIRCRFEGRGFQPASLSAWMRYRRVNQAEIWRSVAMQVREETWEAAIPPACTDSPFPLQYYFLVKDTQGRVNLLPGFDADWCNQPYYVVRQGRV